MTLEKMQSDLQICDFNAQIREVSEQTSSYLEVNYGEDEIGRERILQISYIPMPGDDSTTTQFIKFLVLLPFKAPSDRLMEIAYAITIVNEELALGHFGLSSSGNLSYQYCLALDQDATLEGETLIELVALTEFHQEHFGDYLEGVCEGEVSVYVLKQLIQQTSP